MFWVTYYKKKFNYDKAVEAWVFSITGNTYFTWQSDLINQYLEALSIKLIAVMLHHVWCKDLKTSISTQK